MAKENTQVFNLDTLKENVQNLMRQNNITQEEFANMINMQQSSVSNDLNKNKSNCFTVEQLASIAINFDVSVDDLLGIAPTKKTHDSLTLADSLEKLFEIDDKLGFEIGHFDIEPDVQDFARIPRKVYALYFDDKTADIEILDSLLCEWYQLKNCAFENAFKKHMIDEWKEDKLSDGKTRLKKYRYLNETEQLNFLASLLLDDIEDIKEFPEDIDDSLLLPWNRDLLKAAINCNALYPFFEPKDVGEIQDAIEWLLNNTTPIC